MLQRTKPPTNWRRIIPDLRAGYELTEPWEIVVVELVANSLDVKPSSIHLSYKKKNLVCVDDGKGMSKDVFIDYHTLGSSMVKERNGKTIGWAGVGAKLGLDVCKEIYTETKSVDGIFASIIGFVDEDEIDPNIDWQTRPKKKLTHKTGTYTEVRGINIPPKEIGHLIECNYSHSNTPIFFNGQRIDFQPKKQEHHRTLGPRKLPLVKSKLGNVMGEVWLDEVMEHPGVDIVVQDKTIEKYLISDLNIRIKSDVAKRINGYVRCDELTEAVKLSKDGFQKRLAIFKNFRTWMLSEIKLWLKSIGALEVSIQSDVDPGDTKAIKNTVYTLWLKLPKLMEEFKMPPVMVDTVTGEKWPPTKKPDGKKPKPRKRKEKLVEMPDIKFVEFDKSRNDTIEFEEGAFVINTRHPGYKSNALKGNTKAYGLHLILEEITKLLPRFNLWFLYETVDIKW